MKRGGAHGLKPCCIASFKIFNRPYFAEKQDAIFGLYELAGTRAGRVFRMEKSQTGAGSTLDGPTKEG
jgi:hypothetical protein